MPQPHDVRNSAEFVAVMRQLRQWADLSYRELERRAGAVGDVLPRATLSGALSRQELPREDLLPAFVRACGGDEATVEAWVKVRKRLAVEAERYASAAGSPADSAPAAQDPRQDPRQDPHGGPVEEAPDGADDEAGDTDTAEAAGEAREAATGARAQELEAAPPTAAEPVADVDPGLLAEDVVREGSATAPGRANSASAGSKAAPRRVRRGGVVIAVAAAIVLLAATVTGILRPGRDTAEPQDTRTSGPAVSVSPEDTASRSPAGRASSGTSPKPAEDEPVSGRTRDVVRPTPATKTTRPAQPQPTPSSSTPQPPPYEPPPYEPPPSTHTPPQDDGGGGGGGGDPFPEETCWDVTNDCV
ncbi:helix-turn-helix domain-containing protein [Streptomyces sp. NPDC051662]|uniref:helix-turn-helix domain-containing protein n=1 Tax=Streptomyces sp. NPDC051662 TaxID=3154750 RepID=UPI00343BFBF3